MNFDLDTRRVRMGVGELAEFSLGPRDAGEGASGLWRAQIGTQWHQSLRAETLGRHPDAEFERPVEGEIAERGWVIALTGRIDQLIRAPEGLVIREIKTVSHPLPCEEARLRDEYPGYFIQLAAYALLFAMRGGGAPGAPSRPLGELVFVEIASGATQTLRLLPGDEAALRAQLGRIAEFLDLRLQARQRRLTLRFQPPFSLPREGQDGVTDELRSALHTCASALLFEAPTGFGKTGVLLELALGELRTGHFERIVYLTGKSTGQLQIARTLESMTGTNPGRDRAEGSTPVAAWNVRNKAEHCVNSVFHCVRDACSFLSGAAARWPGSGLARFYLFDNQARDIESLRLAGQAAQICPYEITRSALAFQDVWVGDYNYVFSPSSRGLFYEQPGFQPERTLLLIDEAHNLPGRVAGVYSHDFAAGDAISLRDALDSAGAPAPLVAAAGEWAGFLGELESCPALPPELEEEARDHLYRLADAAAVQPLDYAALGPREAGRLWDFPHIAQQLDQTRLPLLWWSPRRGQLMLTCLDAAEAIGTSLREFGGVVLATATPGPWDSFGAACGTPLFGIRAATPWRAGAYEVACDVRVDTTFQHRARYFAVTAATVAALCGSAPSAAAVFFPSYAYAEAVGREIATSFPSIRAALQPRLASLSAQAAWVEASLGDSDALFLVLGSGFAESIDLLGGRVTRAMVVGPALPEVNPVQRARLQELAGLGREAAVERVYRIPGMQKVNQALGRLVRAPGQRARVLLHCRRFAEPAYEALLAADYRGGRRLEADADLQEWLRTSC
ncbi:MAG: helicase C-terminal domain-containing protein [Opitutaceae bacterium]|jgi:Rad3-related DNA helicase